MDGGDYQRSQRPFSGHVRHHRMAVTCRPHYHQHMTTPQQQQQQQLPPPPSPQLAQSPREHLARPSAPVVRIAERSFNSPMTLEFSQGHHPHHNQHIPPPPHPHSHNHPHAPPPPHPQIHHHQYNPDDYPSFYMVPLTQATQSCNCSSSSQEAAPLRTCDSCSCATLANSSTANEQQQQQQQETERSMTAEIHPTSSTNIIYNTPSANTTDQERERDRIESSRRHYDEVAAATAVYSSQINDDNSNLHQRDEDEVASTTSNSMNTLPTEELESCRGSPFSLIMPAPPSTHDEVSSASEAEHVQFAHTRTTNTTTTTSAAAMKKHKSTTTNVVGSSPTSSSSSSQVSSNHPGTSNGGTGSDAASAASAEAAAGSSSSRSSSSRNNFVIDLVESTTSSNSFRRLSDDQPSTSHRVRLRDSETNSSQYWQNFDEESYDQPSVAWNLHKSSASSSHQAATTQNQLHNGEEENTSDTPALNRFHLRYIRSDERGREAEEEEDEEEPTRSSKIQRLNSNRTGGVHNENGTLIPSALQREHQTTINTNGSYVITYAGHQPPPPPPPPLPHRRRRLETITSSDQAQNFVMSDHSQEQMPSNSDLNVQPSTSRGRVSGGSTASNSKTKTNENNIKPPAVLTAPDLQLDWLSDATTTTTDGEDDEVVFVHSSREPILSIDLTADDESPLALEMSSSSNEQPSSSTTHHQHHPHHYGSNNLQIHSLSQSGEHAMPSTSNRLTPTQVPEDWYGADSLFIPPPVVLSPSNDSYNLNQGPSSSSLPASEPQRAHQSTAGYSVFPFHSSESSSSMNSRMWQDPCIDCFVPEQNSETGERTISGRPTNTNATISSSSEPTVSGNLAMAPQCHTTSSNSNLSRFRSVWRSYLDIPPLQTLPTPMVPTSVPPIPNSPPPIFIVNPYAAEHNAPHYNNTSNMPVSTLGLVGVINANPNPLYLQPTLQDAQNSRQIIPPPSSHLSMSPGSTTPNGNNQYHAPPHPMYHHSHAHTSTRPHENHIITHNHHGHSHAIPHTHGLPHTHTHTFRTATGSHLPPPPYMVHQNLWLRQHNVQEIHRRHMTPTPIDLSSNPLNLTSSFRTRFQQMPNVCSCVHGRNGPVSSLDPVSF